MMSAAVPQLGILKWIHLLHFRWVHFRWVFGPQMGPTLIYSADSGHPCLFSMIEENRFMPHKSK